MAGKATAAPTPPTKEQLVQMIQQQSAAPTTEGFTVQSDGPAGGQSISPTTSASPMPEPGTPARPMLDANEPAVPGQAKAAETPATPAVQQQPGTMQQPGQPTQSIDFEREMREARDRITQLEASLKRDAEQRQEAEFQARLAAMPEAERPMVQYEHEKMLRLQTDLKLAGYELRTTHPLFVRTMDVLASEADVEIDPTQYRAMAAKMEPMLNAIVDERVASEKAALSAKAQQEWGIRPTTEQTATPSPDHPAIQRYKAARQDTLHRPSDPEAMRLLIAAGDEVRRLGLDLALVK